MTNDLLAKATALLEAREKGTIYKIRRHDDDGRVVIDLNIRVADFSNLDDADFYVLAANTITETITGYQELVRRMADILQEAADLEYIADGVFNNAHGELVRIDVPHAGKIRSAARNASALLSEARDALPHTPTNS